MEDRIEFSHLDYVSVVWLKVIHQRKASVCSNVETVAHHITLLCAIPKVHYLRQVLLPTPTPRLSIPLLQTSSHVVQIKYKHLYILTQKQCSPTHEN